MWQYCAKMTEQIKVQFVVETLGDPRHIVLDFCPSPPMVSGSVSEENLPVVKVR